MLWNARIYFAAITHWLSHPSTSGVFSVIMDKSFASHTFTLFMPVPFLRCVPSHSQSNLSSPFYYRHWQHNVSTNRFMCLTSSYSRTCPPFPSHSDVAYIRVYWKEKNRSRCAFSQPPRCYWRWYLGGQRTFSLSVPTIWFFGVYSWLFDGIAVPLLFMIERTGCFAISDLPTFDIEPSANNPHGMGVVQVPLAYHLGVRLGLCLVYLWYWPEIIILA